MLYRDYSSPDDFAALGVTRRNLIETLAEDLCNRADKPWWWLRTPGVAGQAELAGIWSETLGAALRKNMPLAQAEQLYASHFWNCGSFFGQYLQMPFLGSYITLHFQTLAPFNGHPTGAPAARY